MKIVVCPLSQVEQMVAMHAPELVVSLLDPGFAFPELGLAYRHRHLRLHLHDVHEWAPGQVAPEPKHVDQLLGFLRGWQRSSPLLIHCRAGIGRSTAAAFIAACLHNPDADERTIALGLRRASSLARPNQVLIGLADAAMGRNGRMARAIEETGRNLEWHGIDENVPFEIPGIFMSERP
ncbi:MAG: protein-tyrosine phosphatase family protein [Gammaproteobacteria bacterium]